MENKDSILSEFDTSKKKYEQFKNATCQLITDLLTAKDIKVHNISTRVKDRNSLEKKIKSKQNKYSNIAEITDIVGLRIITFFEDEVDKIASIIEDEFKVDPFNSIDKRQKEFDRFGYLSLHYVVEMSNSRTSLTEYQNYQFLKVEIQIRSILQHAWAEVEHDLGYKNKESIPDEIKRNFSRIAALLETADLEFTKLKNSIKHYETTVDIKVAMHPETTDLNIASFKSFLRNNKILLKVDKELSKKTNSKLLMDEFDDAQGYLREFKLLNIESIQDLEENLIKNKNQLINFAAVFAGINENNDDDESMYIRGSSIFYLNYLIALKENEKRKDFLKNFINDYKGFRDALPERNLEFYKTVVESYERIKK